MPATNIAPRRLCFLALAASVWFGVPVRANDSDSVMAAGGLVLVKTSAIAMMREDLTLSPNRVSVRYEMRNPSAEPVTLHIAFPLPDLPYDTPGGLELTDADRRATVHRPSGLPLRQRPNFIGFTVSGNGKSIDPDVEVRSTLSDGTDITEALRNLGGWSFILSPHIYVDEPAAGEMAEYDVGPVVLARLLDLHAIDKDGIPLWRTRITYHWTQIFAPGVTVIEHGYQPVTGGFFFNRSHGHWDSGTEDGMSNLSTAYCVDSATDQAMQRALKGSPDQYLRAETLGYVLSTGANWAGPIGTFHLTVTAGQRDMDQAPVRAIALCTDLALHRTGPQTLEATARDYMPARDLSVLFATTSGQTR